MYITLLLLQSYGFARQGTAKTEETELFNVYSLQVLSIPPHRPRQRKDHPPRIYVSRKNKLDAIATEVSDLDP